jgi:hypothetical protein
MRARIAAVAAVAVLASCATILGVDGDPYVTDTSGLDASQPAAFDATTDTSDRPIDGAPLLEAALPPEGGALDACGAPDDPDNCGTCGHRCATGGCEAGLCTAVLLASGQAGATSVAVDDGGVFWTTSSGVVMCPLAGCSDAGPVVAVPNLNNPTFVTLDDTYLYWASPTGGTIGRCDRATSCADAGVIRAGGTPWMVLPWQGVLVWTYDGDGGSAVASCGGDCVDAAVLTPPPFGGGTTPVPELLAITGADPFVYYTQTFYNQALAPAGVGVSFSDGLSRIDFSNSGQAASLSDASVSGLAVDDAAVYFGGTTGVFSCPINTYCGHSPNQLTDFAPSSPLVVKDGVLYFAGASNTVRRCAAAGCGGPASLSPQVMTTPTGLAVYGAFVYVVDQAHGAVWKLSR